MRVQVTELTPSQKAELDALMYLSDEEIDTSDIPEVLEWRNPRRGLFSGSPSRKAEPNKRLEHSGESGNVAPVADNARLQGALGFISALGLTPMQYEKEEHSQGRGGYRLYVASDSKRRLRFGYTRINVEGTMIVYANGEFSDPEGRFTARRKNNYASYKFWPDDKDAMRYAAKVVRTAYESKA